MDYKLLIVDDDPMMLFLHKNLIMKSGISLDPITFLNGEEVLSFLLKEELNNSYYTILLDLNMPEMNGWQFLEAIKDQPIAEFIDVAIVSSSIDKRDKEKAFSYPIVTSYFSKPFYNMEEIKDLKERRGMLE